MVALRTADGAEVAADAAVVAPGLPAAGHAWAPPSLAASAFFVPDPWAPGALDVVRRDRAGLGDVLLVGTGLTMVDVAFSLTDDRNRADRVVHAISRTGRFPRPPRHARCWPPSPTSPTGAAPCDEVRVEVERHVAEVAATAGDWRPAIDGLRFRVQELWSRFSDEDKLRFLAEDAGRWNIHRHRMAPSSTDRIAALREDRRLQVAAARVLDAEPLPAAAGSG